MSWDASFFILYKCIMLETLMKLWKKALDILWIPQETLWDVEVIKSAVNTMLANKDFAEHITVMDINNNKVIEKYNNGQLQK